MEVGGVNILVAFLAGLVSCVSPCVLPLAPICMSSLVGGSVSASGGVNRQAPWMHALAFMGGFALLFTSLGASVGLVGYVLQDQLPLLEKTGGIFMIIMGLHLSGVIDLSFFNRITGPSWGANWQRGYARSFLTGMFISAGWVPCVGPTLGAILTLAIASGAALEGGALLLTYSLGLAVPFVLIGVTLARTPRLLTWLNRHHRAVGIGAGAVMIGTGILLFTGTLTRLNQYFGLAGLGPGAKI